MSIDNSAHFFYFLLCCLQKKSKNQTVKIKYLKSKITFNKRSLYPMTKTKTNTHFLTKLLHQHQKFHVFYTVHIHPPESPNLRFGKQEEIHFSLKNLMHHVLQGGSQKRYFALTLFFKVSVISHIVWSKLGDSIFSKITFLEHFLRLKIWQKIEKLTTHVHFYFM